VKGFKHVSENLNNGKAAAACPTRMLKHPPVKRWRTIPASACAATNAEARPKRLAMPAYWIACRPRTARHIRNSQPAKECRRDDSDSPSKKQSVIVLGGWALLFALLCLGATTAHACPSGTVFSAYNGNGKCVFSGMGATKAVQCTIMVNSCPSGTTHEHKKSDPNHDYCCPKTVTEKKPETCVWRGTAPFCNGQCEEGERVVNRPGPKMLGCATGSKVYCCR
jgi:hypothetical protein